MATTQVVQTSALPTAFEPFYKTGLTAAESPTGQAIRGLIPQAFGLYGRGTPADFQSIYQKPLEAAGLYGAGRVAGLQGLQTDVQKALTGLQLPTQFGAATTAAESGIKALQNLAGFTPTNISAPSLTQYQMGPAAGVAGMQFNAPEMVAAQTQFAPQVSSFQISPLAAQTAPTMATAQTRFDPNLQRFQMEAPEMVSAMQVTTPQMRAAQMAAPERFGTAAAQEYMSPYMQQVVDVQKREAIRDAQKAQLAQNLAAARQGTYGGARQALATTERERALGTQLGDIQTRGLEAAFGQAQQQFERDRAAGMQAQLANLDKSQQAEVQNQAAALQTQGLNAQQAMQAALANQQARQTAARENLQAALGVQQLGAQTGLQTSLANLSAEQQANVQNQAALLQTQGLNAQQAMQVALANQQASLGAQQLGTQTGLQAALANLDKSQQAAVQNQAAILQTQGLNADQALRAALANQQAGLTVGQQNLQALLGVQQLGAGQTMEAQRANQEAAFRAAEQQRLAALGLGTIGQQLGQLGIGQQAAELDRLKTMGAFGDLQRAIAQQQIDARYADLMRGIQFPESQLEKLSGFIRGVPMTDTIQTTTTPPPSFASQLAGMGLAGLGAYNMLGGRG